MGSHKFWSNGFGVSGTTDDPEFKCLFSSGENFCFYRWMTLVETRPKSN